MTEHEHKYEFSHNDKERGVTVMICKCGAVIEVRP
jgi:hypothetical protein